MSLRGVERQSYLLFHFMKHVLNSLLIIFIIASCSATTPISLTATIVPQAIITLTVTQTSTATFSAPVLKRATATSIPCDPRSEDFCITDGHFIFQRPIKPPANDAIDAAYPYGSTVRESREPHHGVEFLNKFGTPVYAARDGTVIFAGPDLEAIYSPWINFYGNIIVIAHEDDLFTLYAHLSKIDVQRGQEAHTGDKIGEVGQSGVATGSHLHFEVRREDVENYFSTLNPELWLVPREPANGAMAISIMAENGSFRFAELTVSHYLDRNQPPITSNYLTTYSRDLAVGEENASLSDLPAGSYRIAFTMNGQVYERWVEVESGRLTQVVFIVE